MYANAEPSLVNNEYLKDNVRKILAIGTVDNTTADVPALIACLLRSHRAY